MRPGDDYCEEFDTLRVCRYYAIMATKGYDRHHRHKCKVVHCADLTLKTCLDKLRFGMPTDEDFPFTIDCATSITQRGKIEQYQREGRTLPEGWVIDSEGRAGTDPDIVLKGLDDGSCALAPLGGIGEELAGYKGYGYATVVEILSLPFRAGYF